MESTLSINSPTPEASSHFAGLSTSSSTKAAQPRRPRRPCDSCRKRKSRCEIQDGETACVLCKFHHQICLFNENPQPRKRRKMSMTLAVDSGASIGTRDINAAPLDPSADVIYTTARSERTLSPAIRQDAVIDDYANLKGPSLLKATLGLQNHQHSKLLGLTSEFEPKLIALQQAGPKGELSLGPVNIRKVTPNDGFILQLDSSTMGYADELRDLDAIESLVAPHGRELINLYFRIVHPTFPVLHKKVYLEKYERTHREFSPPLLAGVYLLAVNWWSYSTELALLPKPDVEKLEALALRTMSYIVTRPKLSTIQAGLLLLQRPEGESWALTGKLVALGQDLGLHHDSSRWRIPAWEKGLRKRLGWALFMQDKWGALMHGRPSHISLDNWMVKPVTEADFPERAQDEDDAEGSTEVEKGRVLFCEMIRLTEILTIILNQFYTLKAEEEFRSRENEGGRWVLEKAKPIQIALKEWFSHLPECLKMEQVKMRKLNSTGYLYLAYYAAEITLHRRIVRSLEHESDYSMIHICRSAALARLTSAVEFVKGLRAEHLQSFWYAASKYNFALVGTFIGLLWATALTQEEAQSYQERLEEYRWTLRLSSKSAEILDRAASMLATSTGVLVKAIPEKDPADSHDESRTGESLADEAEQEEMDDANWSTELGFTDDISMQASPSPFSESAMGMIWPGIHQTAYNMSATYATTGNVNDTSQAYMEAEADLNRY